MKIRAATLQDLDALVALHYRCYTSKDHLAMVLGRSFMVDLYKWLLTSEKTVAMVAESKRQCAGVVIAYNGPYHRQMLLQNKWPVLRAFLRRPMLAFHCRILKRCVEALSPSIPLERSLREDEDVALISWVSVSPEHRGSGVALSLNKAMMQECRKRGWGKLRAAIYRENVSSRRVYEKLGFREVPLSSDKVAVMFDYGEQDPTQPSTERPQRPH